MLITLIILVLSAVFLLLLAGGHCVRDSGNFGFNASDQMVSLQERQKE